MTTETRSHLPQQEGSPTQFPMLPNAVKDAKASRELLFTLRHFHLGDPGARARLEAPGIDFLPALLHPYRDTSKLRYDYPLILLPAPDGRRNATELAKPLIDWMQEAVANFAAGDGARILKDHVTWLEHQVRLILAQKDGPVAAISPLQEAGAILQEHLQLPEVERSRLNADLQQLHHQLPKSATLLAYGRYAALHLLIHAVHSRILPRRQRLITLVSNCVRGLKELLEVEWNKSTESIEPAQARDSVGPGAHLFNLAALSEVMDQERGTYVMPAERRTRIETALHTLEHWQEGPIVIHFVHGGSLACDWLSDDPSLTEHIDPEPCARATTIFDQQAAHLAQLFAAIRIAQLEINGIYDPAIHNPWFDSFNWEGFNKEELLLVPSIIAVESADRVAGIGLHTFSRLLNSGRPIQVLIRVQPSNNPGATNDEDPMQSYRTELGYIGLAHRQALVAQTSSARYQHLLQSALDALDATRTGLHLVNTGLRPGTELVPLNSWLIAGAALEGRAHPFFRINPQASDDNRFDFTGNPQPERDWPLHPFHYIDENGHGVDLDLAFTFADYAFLVDRLRDHFRLIPPGCEAETIIALQDYLSLSPDEAYQRIPYILSVDSHNQLHRLVISRVLASTCLDRLNFWHSLQELAGVRNHYVDRAIAQTQATEREIARQAREEKAAEHMAELEQVRTHAAFEAMQRLADLLLNIDQAAPVVAKTTKPVMTATTTAPEALIKTSKEIEASKTAETSFDDPWIDTALCTSCNDCVKINPLLFVYTEDKQAQLGDLNQGTYAQLVQAAKLCPAKCIHPGRPWNPDEKL